MALNTVASPVNLPAWDPRLTGSLKATGDKAAVQAQFGKTGATCKACHDEFRKD